MTTSPPPARTNASTTSISSAESFADPMPVTRSQVPSEGCASTSDVVVGERGGGKRAVGVGLDLQAVLAQGGRRLQVAGVAGVPGIHLGDGLGADAPRLAVGLVEQHARKRLRRARDESQLVAYALSRAAPAANRFRTAGELRAGSGGSIVRRAALPDVAQGPWHDDEDVDACADDPDAGGDRHAEERQRHEQQEGRDDPAGRPEGAVRLLPARVGHECAAAASGSVGPGSLRRRETRRRRARSRSAGRARTTARRRAGRSEPARAHWVSGVYGKVGSAVTVVSAAALAELTR